MTPQTIRIGTQTLRYAVTGAPDAPRVLLLFNGIGTSLETAAPLVGSFAATRVIAFDVPGVGESPAPPLPYRLRHVAGLAVALLDHLGVAVADIFGVSWGGAAAQEFAIRHPERCATLTLAATCAGYMMVPGQSGAVMKMLNPRSYFYPAHLLQVGGQLYGDMVRLQRELRQLHAGAMRSPGGHGYLYQLLAIWGWTSWHRLHRVKVPTLVLMGDDDPIVPPINGRLVASRLPRATLETVARGHLFVLTHPGETARRVERFLAEHPLPA